MTEKKNIAVPSWQRRNTRSDRRLDDQGHLSSLFFSKIINSFSIFFKIILSSIEIKKITKMEVLR